MVLQFLFLALQYHGQDDRKQLPAGKSRPINLFIQISNSVRVRIVLTWLLLYVQQLATTVEKRINIVAFASEFFSKLLIAITLQTRLILMFCRSVASEAATLRSFVKVVGIFLCFCELQLTKKEADQNSHFCGRIIRL